MFLIFNSALIQGAAIYNYHLKELLKWNVIEFYYSSLWQSRRDSFIKKGHLFAAQETIFKCIYVFTSQSFISDYWAAIQ